MLSAQRKRSSWLLDPATMQGSMEPWQEPSTIRLKISIPQKALYSQTPRLQCSSRLRENWVLWVNSTQQWTLKTSRMQREARQPQYLVPHPATETGRCRFKRTSVKRSSHQCFSAYPKYPQNQAVLVLLKGETCQSLHPRRSPTQSVVKVRSMRTVTSGL